MLTDSIKLVIFDMAGTTVYDDHYVSDVLCTALALHGYTVPREAADEVMGIAKPVAIKTLLNQFYPDAAAGASVTAIHQDFLRLMIDFYSTADDIREIDGSSEVFRELRKQGVKVGIDTGFSRDITDIIMHRLGWQEEGLVDVSVASDEVANGRPAPDMVYRAMELTGITDVKSVMKVGDTPVDIMEGNNAGCGMVVGVLSGIGTPVELKEAGNALLVDSISDITVLLDNRAVAYN